MKQINEERLIKRIIAAHKKLQELYDAGIYKRGIKVLISKE